MAQTRLSIKIGDESCDHVGQLNAPEFLLHRKSLHPILAGRRSSSLHSGQLAALSLSKRFSRRFTRCDLPTRHVSYEATYRTEPSIKFQVSNVETVIKETLAELLENFEYSAMTCSAMSRSVADEIKDRVKQMGYERYKIVSSVIIGEKKDQGVMVTSRCAWEPKFDDFATSTFQNKSVFCSAQVFGIYLD